MPLILVEDFFNRSIADEVAGQGRCARRVRSLRCRRQAEHQELLPIWSTPCPPRSRSSGRRADCLMRSWLTERCSAVSHPWPTGGGSESPSFCGRRAVGAKAVDAGLLRGRVALGRTVATNDGAEGRHLLASIHLLI